MFRVVLSGASTDLFITTQATWDSVIYVRSGCCFGNELACNDDYDASGNSSLTLHALPAGTYYVVVDSGSASPGTVAVDIYGKATKPLAGDTCANLDTTNYLHAGTVNSATCGTQDNYTGSCLATTTQRELIYWFRIDTATTAMFSTCTGMSCGDTTLTLRSLCNTSSGSSEVACGDDTCTNASCGLGTNIQSSITTALNPGVYYLIVGSRGSSCMPFTLTASGIP